MSKNTMEADVRASVSSLYADLCKKRDADKLEREEKKRLKKEAEELERESKKEETVNLSKKEKRQQEMDAWKEIVIGLTGDDLEYAKPKKKKKKYKKWIGEDGENNGIITDKPKKAKKKNYRKEFEPELNMLKAIVADQNKFTADLQKRFQNAAGPANKDAMPLNKTLVDLAANINTSRNNSLGMLKAIGDLKKTIADLYMKQMKLDSESSGGSFDSTDLGLMGSGIASSLFGDGGMMNVPAQNNATNIAVYNQPVVTEAHQMNNIMGSTPVQQSSVIPSFDPETWDGGPDISNSYVNFEAIPHELVVEWHEDEGLARFKAVRTDTGEELLECPVPNTDPSKLKFNKDSMTVKGEFDEIYKLEIVKKE